MKLQISESEKTNNKKVVVDTSLLIAAVIVNGAYRKLLRKLLATNFELYIPQEVIDEFEKIIKEKKFRKYEPIFIEIFEELKNSSTLLPYSTIKRHILKNVPEDEGIINCCVENHIDYLITHDYKTIGKYTTLTVISAQEFYNLFLAN